MTSVDLPAFLETWADLTRIFPLRGEPAELEKTARSYFQALRRYPIAAVKQGATNWLAQGQKFPKPVEWIACLPAQSPRGDHRQMLDEEAREYRRAELLRWEDHPCLCSECCRAGVDEQPLRFVPEFDENDRDLKVFDPIGQRIVTAGHWAHGEELARASRARADFSDTFLARFPMLSSPANKRVQHTFEQRLAEIFDEPKVRRTRSDLEHVAAAPHPITVPVIEIDAPLERVPGEDDE